MAWIYGLFSINPPPGTTRRKSFVGAVRISESWRRGVAF